ncbi:coil containing protein [Vibrio phage 1.122.B._10N.286.46.F8]|nr:coil containing protein [Vibrio phage 1.122.A._10N.286.46.F8]AUR89415.1 coil containing protein [Vibrio phage 1.122.B._10N.286.46.F8]
MRLTIKRIYQDDCTLGVMNYGPFRCFTLELPYKDNQKNISAIPEGTYKCNKTVSPKFGDCIAVEGVVGRTYIRIHKGNYTRQIEGCILPGESIADIDNDGTPDVTSSVKTLTKLLAVLPDEFELEIK